MEPRLRATLEQFSALVDFMQRNGDLSRPAPGPRARINCDKLWLKLTDILNSRGGGVQRTSDKWKKVWADWKTKTKKKYLTQRRQIGGIAAGHKIRLTSLEKKVLTVMGVPMDSMVDAQAGVPEQSITVESSSEPPSEHGDVFYILLDQGKQEIVPGTPTSASSLPPTTTPSPPPLLSAPVTLNVERHTSASPSEVRKNERQASASPQSEEHDILHEASPRPTNHQSSRSRRIRRLTPFERATDKFTAIEKKRLEYEEERDKRLHEREMERLRLEAARIEVSREHNLLLRQLSLLGRRLIDVITEQRTYGSSPSTIASIDE